MRVEDPALDRYRRLKESLVWKIETVRAARALVVGCGALGNEVAKNLAMLGVRTICLLDRDVVEVANLTRSIFFRVADHGKPKAEILAGRVREFNEDVEAIPIVGDLERRLGLGLLRSVDLVFCCLDSRLARSMLNRMCERVGVVWIDGAMENLFGEVTLYVPGQGPCYECGITDSERIELAKNRSCSGLAIEIASQGGVPTLSTMGSIVAALQVQEGMRFLHGDELPAPPGARFIVDCIDNEFYYSVRARDSRCNAHFRFGEITPVPQFKAAETKAEDVLALFREQVGKPGRLLLARDALVGMYCPSCGGEELPSDPMMLVTEEKARCPNRECGATQRQLQWRCTILEKGTLSDRRLEELGVPPWSVVEVEGADATKWYEITGDSADFPASLSRSRAAAAPAVSDMIKPA